MEFSYLTRKNDLKNLNGKEYEVVIVGGGIVGAGIANVLSANGIKILLIDKGDFASGTSSNSSKLIHGGLRYLAQGHLLLTRELLKERNYLLKNLDFVSRMKFDILIDDSSWSRSSLYFGLFLYNLLGGKIEFPRFKRDGYSYDGYRGHFTYEDASTDDALLVVHNVVSAVMQGATAINYLEATEFKDVEGRVETKLVDRLEEGSFHVKSKIVVNAAGPWVNAALKGYGSRKIDDLRLSKGSHLILKKDKFNLKNAVAFRSHLDRRQMFIIPKGDVVIVGTTDKFVDSPNSFVMDDEEEEYIVDSVRKVFPNVGEEDVVGSYSGIRPLYGSGDDPGRVTRDFHIGKSGKMITIMGVKITNYRSASRKICRQIGEMLNKSLNVRDLPRVEYSRSGRDPLECAVMHECALTVEDVVRRRLGYYYSTTDQGQKETSSIKELLERVSGKH